MSGFKADAEMLAWCVKAAMRAMEANADTPHACTDEHRSECNLKAAQMRAWLARHEYERVRDALHSQSLSASIEQGNVVCVAKIKALAAVAEVARLRGEGE